MPHPTTSPPRSARFFLAAWCLPALLGTGCGDDQPPHVEVDVRLGWVHSPEYAAFYFAEEKGYFAAENLIVNLHQFEFDEALDPITEVSEGRAAFGITSSAPVLMGRASGENVVGLATIYRDSPKALMSLPESGIVVPRDLAGKTVMLDVEGYDDALYKALIIQDPDIDLEDVNVVPRTTFGYEPLLDGEVDAITAFVNNQPFELARQGIEVNLIRLSDYGINAYANVIVTSEDMIANQPEVVEGFVRAFLRGMQDVVADPERAVALGVARGQDLDFDTELESLLGSMDLIDPDQDGKLGLMEAEDWRVTHQLLLDQGLLAQPIDYEAAFDLSFVQAFYSE
jgi:NitT/TauT family transport system substrate-binding protein